MSAWAVVAAVQHMDHEDDEANALMWTADVDSVIRVTMFLENPGYVGGASLQITYTDTFGKTQTNTSGFGANPQGKTLIFKVKGGTPVTLTTSGLPSLGSPSNGYLAIEQMQGAIVA